MANVCLKILALFFTMALILLALAPSEILLTMLCTDLSLHRLNKSHGTVLLWCLCLCWLLSRCQVYSTSVVSFAVGEERKHPVYGFSIQPARDRRIAWVQVVCSALLYSQNNLLRGFLMDGQRKQCTCMFGLAQTRVATRTLHGT